VKSTSTASGIFGLANVTVTGLSPVGVSTDPAATTFGIINGSANATGAVSLTIKADSAGIDGNSTQVVVKSASRACPRDVVVASALRDNVLTTASGSPIFI